jgi:hypothetical protein
MLGSAVPIEEKAGMSRLCIDISTCEMEISMDCFDMIEVAVPSITIDSIQDECDWCPPPPQAFRHRKKDMDNEQVYWQRQQASKHIKNYKAAVGREIVMEEPGKWTCGQERLRECAAKVAQFLRQPSVVQ